MSTSFNGFSPLLVDGNGYLLINEFSSGVPTAVFAWSGQTPLTVDSNGYLLCNTAANGYLGTGKRSVEGNNPISVDANGNAQINVAASALVGPVFAADSLLLQIRKTIQPQAPQ